MDYYSKYPEFARLRGKGSTAVIKFMKPIFARQGIPILLVADNNPFGSQETIEFAKEFPNHQIESKIPTVKWTSGEVCQHREDNPEYMLRRKIKPEYWSASLQKHSCHCNETLSSRTADRKATQRFHCSAAKTKITGAER